MAVKSVPDSADTLEALSPRYLETRKQIGYVTRDRATPDTYAALGYKSGLEVHQQLLTRQKLFCRCPAGLYQEPDDFDAELIRHMRPTLSEMGEYDGTALMEKKTRKNIIYRIKDETACTYDIDDTPPFPLNREALEQALQVALLLDCNIVGELHIARKQYLDGSIPTGFQRTGIVGIRGSIPISNKTVGITQISLEEDSCREISDIGHWRTYMTDRLGMPLIETVTDPDCLTPDELAEAGQYLRYLARSTGRVRTGMGAARQDVNASIVGGTRVEIKGVAHIKWIPELTHNEAFRQKSLLTIADTLRTRFENPDAWPFRMLRLDDSLLDYLPTRESDREPREAWAVCLPGFGDLLDFFNQPGKCFADEIRGRLHVIACVEEPNFLYAADMPDGPIASALKDARGELNADDNDSVALVWASKDDIPTVMETIEERCQMAFEGVPNETRKAFPNGTTMFERVLPGPDRMYPDTDTAPIPISEPLIQRLRSELPAPVGKRLQQFRKYGLPEDTHRYFLKRNLGPVVEQLIEKYDAEPVFVGHVLGRILKSAEASKPDHSAPDYSRIMDLFREIKQRRIHKEILLELVPAWVESPLSTVDDLLARVGYQNRTTLSITDEIPNLLSRFSRNPRTKDRLAPAHWVMGQLRNEALGNMPLARLWDACEKAVTDE